MKRPLSGRRAAAAVILALLAITATACGGKAGPGGIPDPTATASGEGTLGQEPASETSSAPASEASLPKIPSVPKAAADRRQRRAPRIRR